ncbi:MAG: hypothetical protein ABI618_19545, partial [Nitrospirota bacterium]
MYEFIWRDEIQAGAGKELMVQIIPWREKGFAFDLEHGSPGSRMKRIILQYLRDAKGDKTRAARALSIS